MEKIIFIINGIKSLIASIGGILMFIFGGFDIIFITLVSVVIIDYISGVMEAIANKKLSSSVGFIGIVKKAFIFILVALSCLIQNITGNLFPLRESVIMFFIANECLSILENATKLGVPFPPQITDILLQLKQTKELKKLQNEYKKRGE